MKKISMIGCGKLGLPCAEVMNEAYDLVGYDIQQTNAEFPMKSTIREAIEDSSIIFVAVPTPHDPRYDGSSPIQGLPPKDFNYSIVIDVLREINTYGNLNQLVVLISTVLPGTIRKYFVPHLTNVRFIYNPYLIAMGSVKWDMVNPECLIIGTEDGSQTGDAELLIDFYKPLMKNNPRINLGTWDEAECIKIFYNTFISAKLSLVNMIQDVAEKVGNINVDIVTDALKHATQRITGPRYLTAGMGDAGACHPRDNIALRYLSENLSLGYDLFDSIMTSRDVQAKNLAARLVELATENSLPIIIHGKAYKPYVPYLEGSYSLLIGFYLKEFGFDPIYVDPLTGDNINPTFPAVVLLAHNPGVTYKDTGVEVKNEQFYYEIPYGSILVDPWRTVNHVKGSQVIHYGNTRMFNKDN